VLGGERVGVWAGVSLPGEQHRYRDKFNLAVERLRLIAGLARCHRCWEWFSVATPDAAAMDAALAVEEPAADRYQRTCPNCEAAQTSDREDVEDHSAGPGELVDLPPSNEPTVRRYWELRSQGRRASEDDWLLINPDGVIEGRYVWPVAANTFGRTVERFRRMIAEGWTVRQATTGDRNWNRPAEATAVSVSA
jgi:hypothetical protein